MGGKARQSKAIMGVLSRNRPDGGLYVEPFCGALGSAEKVVPCFPKGQLSDASAPLITTWNAIMDGWVPPYSVSEETYAKYAERRHDPDASDPMTAWCGYAISFGGKWYGGYGRSGKGLEDIVRRQTSQAKAAVRKVEAIRGRVERLAHADYRDVLPGVPDGAVVYLDPPYAARTRAHHTARGFDHDEFWRLASDLSERCSVYVSEFIAPEGWETAYAWGDTVSRHHNGGPSDGTNERLFRRRF